MKKLYTILLAGLLFFFIYGCNKEPETQTSDTVTDVDGNVYHTVTIGTQTWMVENLKTTKYRNGNPILNVTGGWDALITGAYCWYNNDALINKTTYGALYNWYTVNTGNLCPTGWHVPSDAEWKQLEMELGMSQAGADSSTWWRGTDQGGQLKESGTIHWVSPNTGATNSSGFTALPGGNYTSEYSFLYIGQQGYFWSSTAESEAAAWYRGMNYFYRYVLRHAGYKYSGMSVRCIKD